MEDRLFAVYAVWERGARSATREGTVVVVVEVFRASTTIGVLVRKGACVVPVASVEEAVRPRSITVLGSAAAPGLWASTSGTRRQR